MRGRTHVVTIAPTVMHQRDRRIGWARLLGLIGVALLLVSAFIPLPNRLSRWVARPARVERAEAIVVLGAVASGHGASSKAAPDLRAQVPPE